MWLHLSLRSQGRGQEGKARRWSLRGVDRRRVCHCGGMLKAAPLSGHPAGATRWGRGACCSRDGQLAGLRGAAGPRELSPLTDGWGQLPVAGHPCHEPRGHLCGLPRWPPAQRLALNVHKAFCSRSGGWAGSIEGPLSEEGVACWGLPLPSTPTAFL